MNLTGAQFDALPFEEGGRWELLAGNLIAVPDIAAKVISPSERTGETRRKVVTYLNAGVKEVWQIYPVTREVLISSAAYSRELRHSENLTTDLLPGFSMPLASLSE